MEDTMVAIAGGVCRALVLACIGGTMFAVGCGSSQLSYAPVSGVVTVDGKPIAGAHIVFSCDDVKVDGPKPASTATTDDSGHFAFHTLTPDKKIVDGAVVGRHRVLLTTVLYDSTGDQTRVVREELLGPEYTTGEKLTVDVPAEGIDDLHLDVSSK